MTQIGLNESEVEVLMQDELLGLGRYTLTAPGGRPVFTKEQRDAITKAVSAALKKNNEEILRQLREAGIAKL